MTKILLLSYIDSSNTTKIIFERAKRHACSIRVNTNQESSFTVQTGQTVLHKEFENIDVVFTRIGSVTNASMISLVKLYELRNIPTVNSSNSILLARNKLLTYQVMSALNIPIPKSASFSKSSPINVDLLYSHLGAPPYIIKLTSGRKGIGVTVADTVASLRSQADLLTELGHDFIVQEFVKVQPVYDIRVLVIGGEATAAFKREVTDKNEFRSNLATGGSASEFKLTPEISNLASLAAKSLELDIAGVDIMLGPSGPLIIEVNLSPGLNGFVNTNQHGAVDALLEYLIGLKK